MLPKKNLVLRSIVKSLISLLLLNYPSFAYGQNEISSEIWNRILPNFINDDTTDIDNIIQKENISYIEIANLSILACKPLFFNYSISHIPYNKTDIDNMVDSESEADGIQFLIIETANLEMAEILKSHQWKFEKDAVNIAATCTWEDLYPLFIKSLPEDFDKLICKDPPDINYIYFVDWLLNEGYQYDYSLFDMEMANSNQKAKVVLSYLLTLKKGSPEVNADKLLYTAVIQKDTASVRKLMEAGEANPNYIANDACLLQYAIRNEDIGTLSLLLENGGNANWINKDSTNSVLLECVIQGNPLLFEALNPYVDDVNLRHAHNSNVLHYLAVYSIRNIGDNRRCYNWHESSEYKEGHVIILASLIKRGIDFNLLDECNASPLDMLATKGNITWNKIAVLYIQNTYIQESLETFLRSYLIYGSEENILFAAVKKIKNLSSVLFDLTPDLSFSSDLDIRKDTLIKKVIEFANVIPNASFWGLVIHKYIKQSNPQMVRWILLDISKKYLTINPSCNTDSIKSIIVNSASSSWEESGSALMTLFENHKTDQDFISMAKDILNSGPDLSKRSKDNLNVYDYLNTHLEIQKLIYKYLQVTLLRNQILDYSENNKTTTDPITGEKLRIDIHEFRSKLLWDITQKSCFDCLINGPGYHNDYRDNIISIEGFGQRNLGSWPKKGCDDFDDIIILDRNKLQTAYNITSGIFRNQLSYPSNWNNPYSRCSHFTSFSLNATSSLKDMKVKCNGSYTIPEAIFNDSSMTDLPSVKIKASHNAIAISQGNNNFILQPSKDTILDRSNGNIIVSYINEDDKYGRTGFEIESNLQFTNLPNLWIDEGSSELQRFKTYIEISRQLSYLNDSTFSNLDKKTILVSIHILSEYALQRKYQDEVIREYHFINQLLDNLGDAKVGLNNFYRNFTTLTKENIPILIGEIELLLKSPGISNEEKLRFAEYLKHLKNTTSRSEFSSLYANIFSDKINLLIESYLTEFQRYTLELIQYIPSEELKNWRTKQLLIEQPILFKKKYGESIEPAFNINLSK